MNTHSLAPIILFTYNRPWHTEQTLEALMKNELAPQSTLFIYCDGPKENATTLQIEQVNAVRKVIRKKQWCKEVYIIESEKNNGLANSIINGVTNVINKHEKVIVLEDDLITSKYFLKYMNTSLDFYENYPAVFSISANRPSLSKLQIPQDYEYDVFVSLRNYCTGWATWKDRWNKVDWKLNNFNKFMSDYQLIEAYNRGGDDLTPMMLLQQEGKIDSWALRFNFAHFVNHAVSILPCISYIDNIGFDGSGIHSGIDNNQTFRNNIADSISKPHFLEFLYEDKRIINSFYNAYCSTKRPLWQKIINRISRLLWGKNVFVIKKKIYD